MILLVILKHELWVGARAGNTRVITQSALQTFQEEMKKAMKDPYKVVLNQTKLPISLLNEKAKVLDYIQLFNCRW